ncbi:uncharacterized protein LOC107878383 [Capsicum annuum]|uniref:uncharacterized protein LOC107878383 n=1 Tax=Capsicum annuum TaxID=4072 RepID=UPI001FB0D567|nr:uncharacterized protein LOC107878383 [Capsicum annuum]
MKAEDSLSFLFWHSPFHYILSCCCISCSPIMVMKSLKHAMKRATPIIAEYLGGAVSCNVYCMTDSRADGFGVSSCILSSLEDARVSPEKKVQAIVVKSNFNPVRNYEELMLSIPQHHGSVITLEHLQ